MLEDREFYGSLSSSTTPTCPALNAIRRLKLEPHSERRLSVLLQVVTARLHHRKVMLNVRQVIVTLISHSQHSNSLTQVHQFLLHGYRGYRSPFSPALRCGHVALAALQAGLAPPWNSPQLHNQSPKSCWFRSSSVCLRRGNTTRFCLA